MTDRYDYPGKIFMQHCSCNDFPYVFLFEPHQTITQTISPEFGILVCSISTPNVSVDYKQASIVMSTNGYPFFNKSLSKQSAVT